MSMRFALLALAVAVVGCASPKAPSPSSPLASTKTTPPPVGAKGTHELHVLLSSDEHGWLVPFNDKEAKVHRGGATAFFDRITHIEGYSPGQHAREQGWLLLSAGDMWTGPYESTVLEGAPMVAAM